MDWFTWVSKTGLEPSLVYEYGLTFVHNELQREDIPHFNHEFLQSMGISIAKHRLQILKLAWKEKFTTPHPMSRILIAALKRTKKCFSKYLREWNRREESALAVVPTRGHSARLMNGMVKRNKKFVVNKKHSGAPLLLTNGRQRYFCSARINSFSSPLVNEDDHKLDVDCYEDYWCSAVEEIRWDTMFQDLKPT